jgi:hypothetical protein
MHTNTTSLARGAQLLNSAQLVADTK